MRTDTLWYDFFMKYFSPYIACGALCMIVIAPTAVFAQGPPAGGLPEAVIAFEGTSSQPLVNALRLIVNGLLIILGIIAAIFVVIGGVRYLTAGSDEDQVESAKRTILYALVGLIIVFLASAIVNFVLNALASAQ